MEPHPYGEQRRGGGTRIPQTGMDTPKALNQDKRCTQQLQGKEHNPTRKAEPKWSNKAKNPATKASVQSNTRMTRETTKEPFLTEEQRH